MLDHDRGKISFAELKDELYSNFEKEELEGALENLRTRYADTRKKEENKYKNILERIRVGEIDEETLVDEITSIHDESNKIKYIMDRLKGLISTYRKYVPARPVKEELVVAGINIVNNRGNRCRKEKTLYRNKIYTVVDEFFSIGLATHGPACKLRDENGYIYSVSREDVEYLEEGLYD